MRTVRESAPSKRWRSATTWLISRTFEYNDGCKKKGNFSNNGRSMYKGEQLWGQMVNWLIEYLKSNLRDTRKLTIITAQLSPPNNVIGTTYTINM